MPKQKPILYPVVFMILITAFFTFLLAFINSSTVDVIKYQEELNVQRSILYVFDIPFNAEDDEAVSQLYEENIEYTKTNGRHYFTYSEAGQVQAYAFEFSGKGLWGSITGHVAFTPDFEKITGVNFIAHSETPGLGGRIDELSYKEQFRDITPISDDVAIIYRPQADGNMDAISGATLTSISVKNMLNESIPEIKAYAKEVELYE